MAGLLCVYGLFGQCFLAAISGKCALILAAFRGKYALFLAALRRKYALFDSQSSDIKVRDMLSGKKALKKIRVYAERDRDDCRSEEQVA